MGFQTLQFWIGFGLFFMLYWGVLNPMAVHHGRRGIRLRNIGILAASCVFYISWDPKALAIIATSTAIDFAATRLMERRPDHRRMWLAVSLIGNLGMLVAFKYFNFFVGSAEDLVQAMTGWETEAVRLDWVLPIGISFYTFQTLGYTFDVYRGNLKSESSFVTFFAFVAFFPQLIAGPIERGVDLMPQFQTPRRFRVLHARQATLRILWGLFKKLVIADRLAHVVNAGYGDIESLCTFTAVLVVFAFTIQLYCDFSGYCDIAIGTAGLLGFQLSENFRRPLLAKNLQDLWQRWHITIHQWFRTHIYLQLPRYRTGLGQARNVLIVFAISGLWHGANWTMVTWGIVNALLMMLLDRSVLMPLGRSGWLLFRKTGQILGSALVYLSLVFFRAPTWDDALTMYRTLGSFSSPALWGWLEGSSAGLEASLAGLALHPTELRVAAFMVLLLFVVESIAEHRPAIQHRLLHGTGLARWSTALALSLGIAFFGFRSLRPALNANDFNPFADQEFIYEQF
jgi:D-alanyl-lipoteichoic acid acyltransferase DltB (MBOAT superfamily)